MSKAMLEQLELLEVERKDREGRGETHNSVDRHGMRVLGPLLVQNLFHGDTDKSLIACEFTVDGFYDYNEEIDENEENEGGAELNPQKWLLVCQSDRQLTHEDADLLSSLGDLFKGLAHSRLMNASYTGGQEHLKLLKGHLNSQTTQAIIFKELWLFLDQLYAIPVLRVSDLSVCEVVKT